MLSRVYIYSKYIYLLWEGRESAILFGFTLQLHALPGSGLKSLVQNFPNTLWKLFPESTQLLGLFYVSTPFFCLFVVIVVCLFFGCGVEVKLGSVKTLPLLFPLRAVDSDLAGFS